MRWSSGQERPKAAVWTLVWGIDKVQKACASSSSTSGWGSAVDFASWDDSSTSTIQTMFLLPCCVTSRLKAA